MRIKVYSDLQEGETLHIKVGDETKFITSFDNTVFFDVDNSEDIKVEIERRTDKSSRSFINILLFVLTILIQGIFNCIFINDDFRWYKSITPFGFKAKIYLCPSKDCSVNIVYEKSSCVGTIFNLPKIKVNNSEVDEIEYIANEMSFKNCWFGSVKRILSLTSIVVLTMGILNIIAINNNKIPAAIVTAVVMVATVVLAVGLSVSQYKKMRTLLHLFKQSYPNAVKR